MSAAKKSTPARKATGDSSASPAKGSQARIAEQMGVPESAPDQTLVEKSSGHIKHLEHGSALRRSAHRKGHGLDQEVKSLAHIYTPWANVRANGSGIVALAAWSKRLGDESKSATKDAAKKAGEFTRGLTHR